MSTSCLPIECRKTKSSGRKGCKDIRTGKQLFCLPARIPVLQPSPPEPKAEHGSRRSKEGPFHPSLSLHMDSPWPLSHCPACGKGARGIQGASVGQGHGRTAGGQEHRERGEPGEAGAQEGEEMKGTEHKRGLLPYPGERPRGQPGARHGRASVSPGRWLYTPAEFSYNEASLKQL